MAGEPSLDEAADGRFRLGVSVSPADVADPARCGLIRTHFRSLTFENVLKWESVQPLDGEFDFSGTDQIVRFAQQNGMDLVGHTLVWHQQVPGWVFESGGEPAGRDVVRRRLEEHIRRVMGRYRGTIRTWDVVNEAVSDDGSESLRVTPWLESLGADYVAEAFRFAREADPDATLLYNDYGIESGDKHRRALALLREWLAAGVPIDGVGLQCHINVDWPDISEIETAIRAFHDLGLQVHITELDMSVRVREFADVGGAEVPRELLEKQAARYGELFRMFVANAQRIERVTFWNIHDGVSWLNDFPVKNRPDFPLLWDRYLRPKPAFFQVVEALTPPAVGQLPDPGASASAGSAGATD